MNKYEPPKRDVYDHVETAARAIATLVPGGSALMTFVQTPIEFRRSKWMNDMAAGLDQLEKKVEGFSVEKIVQSDEFLTAFMHASQAAMRTHREEKRSALRNAVLNVAASRAPDEDLQLVFLNLVDTLTPSQLRMLTLWANPRANPEAERLTSMRSGMGGLSTVLEAAIPELKGRREIYDPMHRDLFNRGLVNTESLHVTMTASGLGSKRTTPLGDQFLAFIASPIE